jgi:hypothetical protein
MLPSSFYEILTWLESKEASLSLHHGRGQMHWPVYSNESSLSLSQFLITLTFLVWRLGVGDGLMLAERAIMQVLIQELI